MEITIKGYAKEIAALVLEMQKHPGDEQTPGAVFAGGDYSVACTGSHAEGTTQARA